MAPVSRIRGLLLALLCAGLAPQARPAAVAATEPQVKAVFVFNFSHFVAWPATSFATPTEPFVIGVLGGDEVAAQLEEAARGERMETHPLLVRRLRDIEEARDCQILYVDRSQASQLERVLALLDKRSTLTVSDLEGAARRGVMIQLAREDNRIRLAINIEAARGAGLTISSNLLRPARIVRSGQ
jgi:hypothetical protein